MFSHERNGIEKVRCKDYSFHSDFWLRCEFTKGGHQVHDAVQTKKIFSVEALTVTYPDSLYIHPKRIHQEDSPEPLFCLLEEETPHVKKGQVDRIICGEKEAVKEFSRTHTLVV